MNANGSRISVNMFQIPTRSHHLPAHLTSKPIPKTKPGPRMQGPLILVRNQARVKHLFESSEPNGSQADP